MRRTQLLCAIGVIVMSSAPACHVADGIGSGVLLLVQIREDFEVVPADVLGLQQTDMLGVALEPAVGEGTLLQSPQGLDALVRLAEQAQPEQPEHDDEQDGADERDEQLGVHPGRDAPDGPDQRVVGRARQPASR